MEVKAKTCQVEPCERVSYARDYCAGHLKQVYRNGRVVTATVRKMKRPGEIRLCEESGCDKKYFSSGKCMKHHSKERRRRLDELKTMQILLLKKEAGLLK